MRNLRAALSDLGLTILGSEASWAAFSPCERYRYALWRSWEPLIKAPTILWIAHNPSTATHEADDPTIRREIGFSKREGCGALIKCNVMAWRSTDKRALLDVADPVGPLNEAAIELCFRAADIAVAAWGVIDENLGIQPRIDALGPVRCLGKTKGRAPRHPLYVGTNVPLEAWP